MVYVFYFVKMYNLSVKVASPSGSICLWSQEPGSPAQSFCQVGQGRVHSVGRAIRRGADSTLISPIKIPAMHLAANFPAISHFGRKRSPIDPCAPMWHFTAGSLSSLPNFSVNQSAYHTPTHTPPHTHTSLYNKVELYRGALGQ